MESCGVNLWYYPNALLGRTYSTGKPIHPWANPPPPVGGWRTMACLPAGRFSWFRYKRRIDEEKK
ncbi:MAG: hypothetical protein ABH867_05110 [Patescibacteria group bacterium]|nr:hypothetical protein [Patescibacteria group bacterium]